MAKHLILDSEAVNAVAHARVGMKTARRALAVMEAVQRSGGLPLIPVVVLAELLHDGPEDAPVNQVLQGLGRIVLVSHQIAKTAGKLLHENKLGAEHLADALVAATAVCSGGGVIVTHDPDDMAKLVARTNVTVYAI